MTSFILLFNIWHIQPHTEGTVSSQRESHYGHIRANIQARSQFFQGISQCLWCDPSERHHNICVQIMGFMSADQQRRFFTKHKETDGVKSGEYGVKQWVHGERIRCWHNLFTATSLTFHTNLKLHICIVIFHLYYNTQQKGAVALPVLFHSVYLHQHSNGTLCTTTDDHAKKSEVWCGSVKQWLKQND